MINAGDSVPVFMRQIMKSALAAVHLLIFATFSARASMTGMNTALTRQLQQKPACQSIEVDRFGTAAFAQERYRIETVCAGMEL